MLKREPTQRSPGERAFRIAHLGAADEIPRSLAGGPGVNQEALSSPIRLLEDAIARQAAGACWSGARGWSA